MTRLLTALLPALGALLLAPAALAGPGMFVGAAEDAARSTSLVHAHAKMELARLAGFDAVRITSIWSPGQSGPGEHELEVLRNVASAAQFNGIRVIVSVYHRDQRTTPLTPRARADFASYAAAIAREAPALRDFIIGNEPNLNLFWMPQFTAKGASASPAAYVRLLADSYDALKAVSPDVNVIGGSVSPRGQDRASSPRQTHSPTRFIPEMGKAYRLSKRRTPIMDSFAFHPYLIPSRLPPTFRFSHPRNTTIGVSDYEKLTKALATAFDGTAQPGSTLPIVYDEFGYQSVIPPEKEQHYQHLDAPAARDAIPEALQAAYYRQALAIVQCQPNVAGMLLFHVTDESDARAWQSGVFYADDTPKSSLPVVRAAARAAQEGKLARCPAARAKRVNPLRAVVWPDTTELVDDHADWGARLTCDRPCRYDLRIERVLEPEIVSPLAALTLPRTLGRGGSAPVGVVHHAALPSQALLPGRYQYVLRVFEARRAGTAVVRISKPFSVGPDPTPPGDPVPPHPPPEPPAPLPGGE